MVLIHLCLPFIFPHICCCQDLYFAFVMPTNTELAREVDLLRREVEEMKNSLTMFNEICENMKQEQARLTSENKALKKENEHLSKRLGEAEQYSRVNNIEIKGVPCTKNEDCVAILKAIGDEIGCPVIDADIDVVHRVPAKHDKNIIARFCSRTKKTDFVAKARKARLNTTALGFPQTQQKNVFVNEHLTPDNKRLFAQALARKKDHGWKFLWTSNCRIKARKDEDSRVHVINSANDLSVIS